MQEGDLIRKIRLISKYMTSQPGKQLQYTHSLISQEVKAIDNEIWSVSVM